MASARESRSLGSTCHEETTVTVRDAAEPISNVCVIPVLFVAYQPQFPFSLHGDAFYGSFVGIVCSLWVVVLGGQLV